MQLTTTQRQILVGLLLANKPVTIPVLAQALNVSPSTIERQLELVAFWLEEQGYRMEQPHGKTVRLDASPEAKQALLRTLAEEAGEPSALTLAERRKLLAFTVHVADGPLISRQLQNLLQVSRSTVLKDLSAVAKWYEARDLFLIRRPNYGIRLKGKESDWRRVFVEMILDHFDEPTLLRLCSDGDASTAAIMLFNPPLAQPMIGYLQQLPLGKARELVRVVEAHLHTRFADADHLALTLHVALLTRRLREGRVVELDQGQLQAITGQSVYRATCEIAQRIEKELEMIVPQGEIGHLSMQFLGAKLDDQTLNNIPADARFLADAVLRRASSLLKCPLDADRELANRLATHLVPTLQRLQLHLPIRNPLLDEIRNRYDFIYETAETASKVIGDYLRTEVPADEVAYIAMYLAGAVIRQNEHFLPRVLIVCPSGSATSWLLHSRLRKEFPDIPIVDILSTRDLARGIPAPVDLIISTVPLAEVEIPAVVVTALLDGNDVREIQRAITALTQSVLEEGVEAS